MNKETDANWLFKVASIDVPIVEHADGTMTVTLVFNPKNVNAYHVDVQDIWKMIDKVGEDV